MPPNFMPQHPFNNGELRIRDERLAPFPRTEVVVRQHIAAYYAMITHLDAQIGRVLAALEETGHADDTLVIFSADNGLAVGQHGLFGKQNLYEHSVKEPLIFAGPAIPRGERRDALCYLHDLFPTVCDLTGIPVPASVEGQSLAPVLAGRQPQVRDSIFCAYKGLQRSVRVGRFKLIHYTVRGMRTRQLFDLEADPWETRNLADEPPHAPRIAQLEAHLQQWQRRTGDPQAPGPEPRGRGRR